MGRFVDIEFSPEYLEDIAKKGLLLSSLLHILGAGNYCHLSTRILIYPYNQYMSFIAHYTINHLMILCWQRSQQNAINLLPVSRLNIELYS
ncbi:hypothetical protein THRCLA_21560 [Thraustotheca clavata]|uniref:Uncharacterized protein n=1 Tax=Thraustotheca clavata TaxID=74557 RepID=A0A1V9ZVA2_9STRA|nr:hypothetical protein THRCLA_21560 [Thraustotheca clavata]